MSKILSVLSAIISNPTIRAIFAAVLNILKNQATDMLPKVLSKVVEVMALPISSDEKYQKVFDEIKAEYPAAKDNVINALIELAVLKVKQEAGVSQTAPAAPAQ
jgi:hypothetical protein